MDRRSPSTGCASWLPADGRRTNSHSGFTSLPTGCIHSTGPGEAGSKSRLESISFASARTVTVCMPTGGRACVPVLDNETLVPLPQTYSQLHHTACVSVHLESRLRRILHKFMRTVESLNRQLAQCLHDPEQNHLICMCTHKLCVT